MIERAPRGWSLFARWVAGLSCKALKRLNFWHTYNSIRAFGAVYGTRFVIGAVIWEVLESVVLPAVAWGLGHPHLAVLFLVAHLEVVVYPLMLLGFSAYDRWRNKSS